MLNIAGRMQHAKHEDAVIFRAIVKAVFAHGITSAVGGKFGSGTPNGVESGQVDELLPEAIHESISLENAVVGHVVPDLFEIGLGGNREINLRHLGLGVLCGGTFAMTFCQKRVHVEVPYDFAAIRLIDGQLNICTERGKFS